MICTVTIYVCIVYVILHLSKHLCCCISRKQIQLICLFRILQCHFSHTGIVHFNLRTVIHMSSTLPSLKLTFSPLKMDGWNTVLTSFWGVNRPIFRWRLLLVSGRVYHPHRIHGTGIFTYIYHKNQPFM